MIFNFTLKFFELFKCFRLVFHQVDIPISAQIICEGEKITISATSLNIHRTTYICMYDFQQICCSLHSTGERCLSHLAHEARFHNQVVSKVHQYGVSSCALYRYDLNSSATNKLHFHYQLCIFWLQLYEYVYHYYRDSSKIDTL